MYGGSYSGSSNFNLQAQKKMKARQKGKSCGYYLRIIFFFSSLIQSLIIVCLVLFLIYGKQADSADSRRWKDLNERFSQLSLENRNLTDQRKNLTITLNDTLTMKARSEYWLYRLQSLANKSIVFLNEMNTKLTQCNGDLQKCRILSGGGQCPPPGPKWTTSTDKNCETQLQHQITSNRLLELNFTQSLQRSQAQVEQLAIERDNINLEAIRLRSDKAMKERELADYKARCKEEFAHSLSGISNVSRAFLVKVNALFAHHIPFHLSCQKLRGYLEQINGNCTSLSREVEDRFQRYLDSVGGKVSDIMAENSQLKAENWQLKDDHLWCSKNRTELIQEQRESKKNLQLKWDKEKEKLLLEKKRVIEDKSLQDIELKVKEGKIEHLQQQLSKLNATCGVKAGFQGGSGSFGVSSSGSSSYGLGIGSTGVNRGSSSVALGSSKPVSSGTGYFNKPVSSGTGYVNKPVSSGTGFFSKPASSSPNSTGMSSSKLGSTPSNTGYSASSSSSSGTGSRLGSTSSNTGYSSGTGSRPGSTSSNTGYSASSSSSSGTGSRLGSTSSNTGYSASSSSSSGTGSRLGAGLGGSSSSRTSTTGLGSSSLNRGSTVLNGVGSSVSGSLSQHLHELEHMGKPQTIRETQRSTNLGSTSFGSTGLGSTGLGGGGLGRGAGGLGSYGSSAGGLTGSSSVGLNNLLRDLDRATNPQAVQDDKRENNYRTYG